MNKNFLALFILALFSCTVTADSFTFWTGAGKGKDIEVIKLRLEEAFKRHGHQFHLKHAPSRRAMLLANTTGDGDAHRVANIKKLVPEHTSNLVKIPFPILVKTASIFVLTGNEFPVEGWQSLNTFDKNGYRLGVRYFQENVPNNVYASDTETLMYMLISHKISTATLWTANGIEALHDHENLVTKLEPVIATLPVYSWLNKKHEKLVPLIAKSLADMKEDGSYEQIYRDVYQMDIP